MMIYVGQFMRLEGNGVSVERTVLRTEQFLYIAESILKINMTHMVNRIWIWNTGRQKKENQLFEFRVLIVRIFMSVRILILWLTNSKKNTVSHLLLKMF